jgi:hypothetical protein
MNCRGRKSTVASKPLNHEAGGRHKSHYAAPKILRDLCRATRVIRQIWIAIPASIELASVERQVSGYINGPQSIHHLPQSCIPD